jgi:cell shape-determining protein MreC
MRRIMSLWPDHANLRPCLRNKKQNNSARGIVQEVVYAQGSWVNPQYHKERKEKKEEEEEREKEKERKKEMERKRERRKEGRKEGRKISKAKSVQQKCHGL